MDERGPPQNRKITVPKGFRDRVLFVFLIISVPLIGFFDFVFVAPRYHETFDAVMWVHAALAAFIAFNIYANLFKLLRVGSGVCDVKTPSVLPPGWKYCRVCDRNAPPRSHHCSVCRECILKHDHHCIFTGRCIGFYNQRYFIVALLYMTVGLLYSLAYKSPFLLETLGGMSTLALLQMVAPHFGLLLGSFDAVLFLMTIINLVEIVVLCLCTYLLVTEIRGVAANQTTYEMSHGIRTYGMGLKKNLREALGSAWYLVWLSPWIDSPIDGDGLHFDGSVVCVTKDGEKQE